MINTPLVAYVRYMRIEIVDRHARGLEKKQLFLMKIFYPEVVVAFYLWYHLQHEFRKFLHLLELKF